ncbi:MAG: hypothetical protein V3T17_10870 [Pseudomonadales bacterium]
MGQLSNTPHLAKGAIIGVDLFNPLSSLISFQYNPQQLTRTLNAQTASADEGDRSEALRLKGPPTETISLDIDIDAADQLEKSDSNAVDMGIYPQLSALEMLIYPKTLDVLFNTVLQASGSLEILPCVAPLTLFIWGKRRIVPVRITDFSITEEQHDSRLNPVRAKVSLGLQILNYNDLSSSHFGYWVFFSHQVIKEIMATMGSSANVGKLGSSLS